MLPQGADMEPNSVAIADRDLRARHRTARNANDPDDLGSDGNGVVLKQAVRTVRMNDIVAG